VLKSKVIQLLFAVTAVLFLTLSFAATASGLKPDSLTDTIYGYWVIGIFIEIYCLVIIEDIRLLRQSNPVQSGNMQIL